jgi:peptidoglycan/xylan/chitin deacetylase (PgdA/CDA1 family)
MKKSKSHAAFVKERFRSASGAFLLALLSGCHTPSVPPPVLSKVKEFKRVPVRPKARPVRKNSPAQITSPATSDNLSKSERSDPWPSVWTVTGMQPDLSVLLRDPIARTYPPELDILLAGTSQRREIALTFDDGPHPEHLPRLLALLREHNVKATFFLIGQKVEQHPDLAHLIVQDGHEIANHTYTHLTLSQLPSEEVEAEIVRGNQAIEQACGVRPRFFRPPGGKMNDEVLRIATRLGMTTVLWTENPGDYSLPTPDLILHGIVKSIHPGSVVLLHNGIKNTEQMLPTLITYLRRQGYEFVTLTEMTRTETTLPEGQNKLFRRAIPLASPLEK